jgi:FKBP-type peptidyl-prolyl cis-trans isomerase (trigger factor)
MSLETEPEVVATPEAAAVPTKASNRNLIIGVATMLVAIGVGYFLLFSETKFTSLVPFNESLAVAVVNGEKIERFELDKSTDDLMNSLAQQGMDVTADGFRTQVEQEALTRLINTKLLLQKAQSENYTASDEEVNAQLATIEASFGGRPGLDTRLGELGITYDMLVEDVKEQVIVTSYLEATTPILAITATPEEIGAYYETLKAQYGENLPPFAEIQPQVEQEFKAQKQQQIVGEVIATLRSEAAIEIKI